MSDVSRTSSSPSTDNSDAAAAPPLPPLLASDEDALRFEFLMGAGGAGSVQPSEEGLTGEEPPSNESEGTSASGEGNSPPSGTSNQVQGRQNQQDQSSSGGSNSGGSSGSGGNPSAQHTQSAQDPSSSRGSDSSTQSPAHHALTQADNPAAVGLASSGIGESILSFMGSAGIHGVSETASPGASRTIAELGSELVERMLSSGPEEQDSGVLLEFKDDVLPETEVRLFKQENGVLNVNFSTASGDAASLLSKHQAGLADYLQNRLGLAEVKIDIEKKGAADQGGGDGRSRGQRSVLDEYEPT